MGKYGGFVQQKISKKICVETRLDNEYPPRDVEAEDKCCGKDCPRSKRYDPRGYSCCGNGCPHFPWMIE